MRCLAAVPILPFILAGCATLGPPASHAPGNEAGSYTVAFDPAQSPGQMIVEEAEDVVQGAEKAFAGTLWGTRQGEIRVRSEGVLWRFVMGQGQDLPNGVLFRYDRMDPRVRQYPLGQVHGTPLKINTGTDVQVNTNAVYAASGLAPFMLSFSSVQEAEACSRALWLLKRRAAGEKVLTLLDRGAAFFKEGRREEARSDAVRLIERDPRLSVAYAGKEPLSVLDLEARRKTVEEAMARAKACDAAGDVPGAFRNFLVAYGALIEEPGGGDLMRLYPKLKEKPGISEPCRRLLVQAQTLMDAKRYFDALDTLAAATWAEPYRPEIWFNLALIRGEGEDCKDLKAAVEHMKTYLKLAPDAPDARMAQDKIYAWEALGGK